MKKLIVLAALLYGGYRWISQYTFADTLVFAKKHPQASWAPAMDYWVGIVYYQRSEYPMAEQAFTQLLTDYSTGPYTAKGLLKLSAAAEENRNWEVARQSLQRFIEEFPDDKEKRVAEQKLEYIKFK